MVTTSNAVATAYGCWRLCSLFSEQQLLDLRCPVWDQREDDGEATKKVKQACILGPTGAGRFVTASPAAVATGRLLNLLLLLLYREVLLARTSSRVSEVKLNLTTDS